MSQTVKHALIIACAVYVPACASMTTGTNQSLSVVTTGCPGASCELKNDKGIWYVPSTPGSVNVHRAYGNMTVTCKKEGYPDVVETFKSSTKGMATGNIVWGILLPVGAGVDMATGAAYDYPGQITVPMDCINEANS